MTVGGGASHREWDLPIYVISVEPGGVISRDGRIKTGTKIKENKGMGWQSLGGVSSLLGSLTALPESRRACKRELAMIATLLWAG